MRLAALVLAALAPVALAGAVPRAEAEASAPSPGLISDIIDKLYGVLDTLSALGATVDDLTNLEGIIDSLNDENNDDSDQGGQSGGWYNGGGGGRGGSGGGRGGRGGGRGGRGRGGATFSSGQRQNWRA